MEIFTDFLVNNYMWFLVITIVLVFSLIGYIVDTRENKEVKEFIDGQEMEQNLKALANAAQNKTIGDAVNKTAHPGVSMNNTIQEMPSTYGQNNYNQNMNQVAQMQMPIQNTMNQPIQNSNNVPTNFEILGK